MWACNSDLLSGVDLILSFIFGLCLAGRNDVGMYGWSKQDVVVV